MRTTSLSWMLGQQLIWQTISSIKEEDRVKFMDVALKGETSSYKLPHRRLKKTIKIFSGILEYPTWSDYDCLSFMDNGKEQYEDRARFLFQSYNEFYEDKDYRNDIAEIMQDGETLLGIRYTPGNLGSRTLNNAEDSDDFTPTLDATAVAEDTVFYDKGNGSIRVSITSSAGSAMIENSFDSFDDTTYKKKYHFKRVYLDAAPTSITLRFGKDSSNYLSATATTQFDGSAFKADDWNWVSMDLNSATATGTVDGTDFAYEAIILTGADTGTYYIDSSYLKEWALLNVWYYSINQVKLAAGTYQEGFYNIATEEYKTDSVLVGPTEWANYINYQAMILMAMDKNDKDLVASLATKAAEAKVALGKQYPVVKPLITNRSWRFRTDLRSRYVNLKAET